MTSATWRSGPTKGCGTRHSGSGRARGRPTARSSRSRPGCARPAASTYDESPPRRPEACRRSRTSSTEGKRGYCQHFAGAMALMLRFLGIPARVAAGFTSGKREDGGWTVTDHNAHAWVEVWFPEYGWLAFDPTPGRGALAAAYSVSSSGFNAGDAADAFGPRRGGASGGRRARPVPAEGAAGGAPAGGPGAGETRRPADALAPARARAPAPAARSARPSSSGGASAT